MTTAALDVGQRPEALELWRQLWLTSARRNRHHLEWKYDQNPIGSRPILSAVADDDGRLIGLAGAIEVPWIVDGRALRSACLGDLIVDEQSRGGPVLADLVDHIKETATDLGIEQLHIYANGPYVPFLAVNGWRTQVTVGWAERRGSVTGDRSVAHRLRPFGPRIRSIASCTDPTERRWAQVVDFVAGRAGARGPHPVRDELYYRWRYANPLSRFRWLFVERDGELEGFLVAQIHAREVHRAHVSIVEWEWSSESVQRQLLHAALSMPHATMSTWATPDRSDLLAEEGFELQLPTGRASKDAKLVNLMTIDLDEGAADDRRPLAPSHLQPIFSDEF